MSEPVKIFRTRYARYERRRTMCPGGEKTPKGRTKQSFKDECDVNKVMAKYFKTGELPEMIRRDPQYGDFSNVPDYLEACAIVQRAEAQFEALPSVVRERFDNDPEGFLAFATDEKNRPELETMGLINPSSKGPEKPSGERSPEGQGPKGAKPPEGRGKGKQPAPDSGGDDA